MQRATLLGIGMASAVLLTCAAAQAGCPNCGRAAWGGGYGGHGGYGGYHGYATAPATPVIVATTARLRVTLPTAEAKLWIQDQPTQQQGLDRVFESPSLDAGKSYTYSLKATWMENGKEVSKKIDVDVRTGAETPVKITGDTQVAEK